MVPDPIAPSFEIEGNTLRVSGELGVDEERAFEQALRTLLATSYAALVVDLSGVKYASSGYVRHIAMAIMEAKRKNRTITLRASRRIARLLQIGGVDRLAPLEVVNGP